MMTGPDPALRKRLHTLAALLPIFEAPEFVFGHWNAPAPTGAVMLMPYFIFSPGAEKLLKVFYKQGWALTEFDWPAWTQTREYARLREGKAALSKATPDQLARLLTVIVRQDRFVEGSLNGAHKSGLLIKILRRAAELEAEMPKAPRKPRKKAGSNPVVEEPEP